MNPTLPSLATQFLFGGVLALIALLATAVGCGGTSDANEATASESSPEEEDVAPAAATVELGQISISQVRPLENSTVIVHFQAHAAATPENAKRLASELKRHHHKAREQVIVAVRTAESWEFDEPELLKLRRRIVLRLNRWLDAPIVEDVVLTDFRFRVD